MDKKSFILYTDTYEAIADLSQEDKGDLLDAIYLHAMGEDVPELSGEVAMAWRFIKLVMNRDNEHYQEVCRKRAEAGRRGRAAKIKQNEQMSANADKCQQMPADNDNDNDNDSDNDSGSGSDIIDRGLRDRLLKDETMMAGIVSTTGITKKRLLAIIPDFHSQLTVNGGRHKNYNDYCRHLQAYIRIKQQKNESNGNSQKRQNGAFEPVNGVDYSRTDF